MKGWKADSLILIKIVLLVKARQIQCYLSTAVNQCLTYLKTQNFKPVIGNVHFFVIMCCISEIHFLCHLFRTFNMSSCLALQFLYSQNGSSGFLQNVDNYLEFAWHHVGFEELFSQYVGRRLFYLAMWQFKG
jgi:hypothetical protein